MNLFVHAIALAQMKPGAVGTFVTNADGLLDEIEKAVGEFDFPEDGQGFVSLPESAFDNVLPGVVAREGLVADQFKAIEHRGEVILVADREKVELGRPDGVAVIVYTKEAFMADPQTTDDEKSAFDRHGYTHCLVTTLAFLGPKPPVSSHRFVRNLAGGNAAYADKPYDDLVAEAQAIRDYEQSWVVVG